MKAFIDDKLARFFGTYEIRAIFNGTLHSCQSDQIFHSENVLNIIDSMLLEKCMIKM